MGGEEDVFVLVLWLLWYGCLYGCFFYGGDLYGYVVVDFFDLLVQCFCWVLVIYYQLQVLVVIVGGYWCIVDCMWCEVMVFGYVDYV